MLLSSRKDSHDYQLMPEVDLDTKQDLLIEKEVYSSFNGVRLSRCLLHTQPAYIKHLASLSSCAWQSLVEGSSCLSLQASLAWRRSFIRKGMTG
jgi:hypothetical protein